MSYSLICVVALKGTGGPTPPVAPASNSVLCCAFNADGSIFVTGSSDKMARVICYTYPHLKPFSLVHAVALHDRENELSLYVIVTSTAIHIPMSSFKCHGVVSLSCHGCWLPLDGLSSSNTFLTFVIT